MSGLKGDSDTDFKLVAIGSDGKESACNAEEPGLSPGLGRSPREWKDDPLQYSCLENLMDRRAWQVTVHRVTKSQTQLSDFQRTH